jgi:hypothetical protein
VDLDTEAGPEDVPRDNWRRNSLGRSSEASLEDEKTMVFTRQAL